MIQSYDHCLTVSIFVYNPECILWYVQAGVIEEFVNEAIDNALDSEDMEEEIDEEVDKVLTAIAGETAAELPVAVRKERIKVPAQKASTSREVRWLNLNMTNGWGL